MNLKNLICVNLFCAGLVFMQSCTSVAGTEPVCTKATLEVEDPGPYRTKAAGALYDRVSDLVLFASDRRDPGKLAASLYFEGEGLDKISFFFPDAESVYDIYVLANFGDVRDEVAEGFNGSGMSLSSYLSSYRHRFADYGTFESKGLPMSGTLDACVPGSNVHIRLRRLAALVDVKFELPASVKMKLTDFCLYQCAAVAAPFASTYSAYDSSEILPGAAYRLSPSQLSSLSEGNSVRMCLLENSQGCLLGGNASPDKKVPSNTPRPGCISYYEFHADVVVADGTRYADAMFRFCLGRDATTDFSVDRNTLYTYRIGLGNSLDGISWIIDPGEPQYPQPEVTGHYKCDLFWDEGPSGQQRSCSESLYFDLKSGKRQESHVPFRYYHYDIYGNEYVFGPYTTMNAYISDWNYEYGQYDVSNPEVERDRIVIHYDSQDYVYDYVKMNIIHE